MLGPLHAHLCPDVVPSPGFFSEASVSLSLQVQSLGWLLNLFCPLCISSKPHQYTLSIQSPFTLPKAGSRMVSFFLTTQEGAPCLAHRDRSETACIRHLNLRVLGTHPCSSVLQPRGKEAENRPESGWFYFFGVGSSHLTPSVCSLFLNLSAGFPFLRQSDSIFQPALFPNNS